MSRNSKYFWPLCTRSFSFCWTRTDTRALPRCLHALVTGSRTPCQLTALSMCNTGSTSGKIQHTLTLQLTWVGSLTRNWELISSSSLLHRENKAALEAQGECQPGAQLQPVGKQQLWHREQYIPKEVTKCSCALRVFMHRLFLKSQTRRVLSSAQLKINFPPEWNRTPRTQLSWPTLCTRRDQWAGWELSIPHLTLRYPCLAPQGQRCSSWNLPELTAYLQFLLLHLYQLSQQCKFLCLTANKQQSSCDLH